MENQTITLAGRMASQGWKVRLVIINNQNPAYLPSSLVEVINLNASKISLAFPKYLKFLHQYKPHKLISISGPVNILAIAGKLLSGYPKNLLVSERNHLSSAARYWVRRMDALRPFLARWLYPAADRVLCVSRAVRDDLIAVTGLPPSKVVTAYNLFDLNEIRRLAKAGENLPAFHTKEKKIILSVGRLSRQKDYATLIRAFALVREQTQASLFILGDGPLTTQLKALADSTGFGDDILFEGFISNPYPYFQRADLVVLSSLYEGLPGVLIEALALAKTCLATNSPGGSGEILADGQAGYLCPVGDSAKMAKAILLAFEQPIPAQVCLARAEEFSIDKNFSRVLELINESQEL